MADNEAIPDFKKQYPLGHDFHASARFVFYSSLVFPVIPKLTQSVSLFLV